MGKALIIKGADFSQVAVDTIDIVVGQPTISIDLFGNVTITSPNGEDIYYTTDGSTPTNQSTKYTAAFNVALNTTVKAVCYLGGNYSEVASRQHDGTLQAPTISITPNGIVTITATNNASIRYTVNGADPTSSTGTLYSDTFSVDDGDIVKAIAFLTSGNDTIVSSVASETAVVNAILWGKRLDVDGAIPEGGRVLIDDQDYLTSPKIPATAAGGTITYNFVHATFKKDVLIQYAADGTYLDYSNIAGSGDDVTSLKAVTPNANLSYIRLCCKIGTGEGTNAVQGGVALWTYDGSPAPSE